MIRGTVLMLPNLKTQKRKQENRPSASKRKVGTKDE